MSFLEKQCIRNFTKGQTIFKEDDPGNSMFIIKDGKVEVHKIIENKKVPLAVLEKGAIFGEMALIDNKPRSASISAVTDVTCMEITDPLFKKMLAEVPTWMQSFYTILVDRLRVADDNQNHVSPLIQSKQIIILLHTLSSLGDKDMHDNLRISWNKTTETISFLLSVNPENVRKVFSILISEGICKTELNYEKGQQLVIIDQDKFDRFIAYCQETSMKKKSSIMPDSNIALTSRELQNLELIKVILKEQKNDPKIIRDYFNDKCAQFLNYQEDDIAMFMKNFIEREILSLKREGENSYVIVNLEKYNMLNEMNGEVTAFKTIEKHIESILQ